MAKTLLDILAELANKIKEFDQCARTVLSNELQQRTELIPIINTGEAAEELRTFLNDLDDSNADCAEKLRNLFGIDHDLSDADLALINAGVLVQEGDVSDRAHMCRDAQRKLSQVIGPLFDPGIFNSAYLVSAYFSTQIYPTYDRMLGGILRGECIDPDLILGAFDTLGQGVLSHSMYDELQKLQGNFTELDLRGLPELHVQICSSFGECVEQYKQTRAMDSSVLDYLLSRYELVPSMENLKKLLAQYRDERFPDQYKVYHSLCMECDKLRREIERLRAVIQMYYALRHGALQTSAPQEPTLRKAEELLRKKQAILDRIEYTADPQTFTDYDPEVSFTYAQILLLRGSQTEEVYAQVQHFLNSYLSHSAGTVTNHFANKITANGMLYMLNVSMPFNPADTLRDVLVQRALELEKGDPQYSCGFAYYIDMLWVLGQMPHAEDIITGSIEPRCLDAVKKGFDFRSLVDKVLITSHRVGVISCLSNASIVSGCLEPIDPEISRQYAHVLLALICQELQQHQAALAYLHAATAWRFTDLNMRESIMRIFGVNTHAESIGLFRGLIRTLEGEMDVYCMRIRDYKMAHMPDSDSQDAKMDEKVLAQIRYVDEQVLPTIQSIIDRIEKIRVAKENNCLVEFLTIVRAKLEAIANIPLRQLEPHIQVIISNTIKQILDIINREYLIFSVNPKILPPGLGEIIEQLKPFAPEVFQAYQELAKPFRGIIEFCYQQIPVLAASDNMHRMFHHQDPIAPDAAVQASPEAGLGDIPNPGSY